MNPPTTLSRVTGILLEPRTRIQTFVSLVCLPLTVAGIVGIVAMTAVWAIGLACRPHALRALNQPVARAVLIGASTTAVFLTVEATRPARGDVADLNVVIVAVAVFAVFCEVVQQGAQNRTGQRDLGAYVRTGAAASLQLVFAAVVVTTLRALVDVNVLDMAPGVVVALVLGTVASGLHLHGRTIAYMQAAAFAFEIAEAVEPSTDAVLTIGAAVFVWSLLTWSEHHEPPTVPLPA